MKEINDRDQDWKIWTAMGGGVVFYLAICVGVGCLIGLALRG
jgi:hypothetical protein